MSPGAIAPCRWHGDASGFLEVLDQTRLPNEERWLRCESDDDVVAAIRRLSVRGAPAIGIAAAYGCVLAARRASPGPADGFRERLAHGFDALEASRPTAINLAGAITRMRAIVDAADDAGPNPIGARLLEEADAIRDEEAAACDAMAAFGAALLPDPCTVVTHCHTGALAAGGIGTAVGVIVRAHRDGKTVHAFVDETRPLLQGARITAFELGRLGVPATLICDSAAAGVLASGTVDAVLVGADRIAANGDVANKVGTLGLAVLANAFSVPFYVVAPTSTIDPATPTGAAIPIEERARDEVVGPFALPRGVGVRNPAFDVTPAARIAAIVTDRGVLQAPFTPAIRRALGAASHTG